VTWAGAAIFLLSLLHFVWRYFVTFAAPAPPDAGVAAVAVNLGLFSLFALHHSALARTRAKDWIRHRLSAEHERTLYVWVASVLFLAVAYFWRPVSGVAWDFRGWLGAALWAGQLAGIVLTAWSAAALGILELSGVRPAKSVGPDDLRSDGPYGLVRHPIYFAWLLLVWSVAFMNGTRLSFAAISTLYLAIAIPFEERSLEAHFGPAYSRYQRQVRWRMLPFVY
jgi:protein-S-isoprenylcysteine O-methyltransferase Ste14